MLQTRMKQLPSDRRCLITVSEAAGILGITEQELLTWINDQRHGRPLDHLPVAYVQLGHELLFPRCCLGIRQGRSEIHENVGLNK